MPSARRFADRGGGLLAALLLVAGAVALFLPALTGTYLYHDDWVHRVAEPWAFRSSPSFLHLVLMGRPVCSACTFVHFSLFETIETAGIGRLAVVLELAAAAVATSRFLEREGVDRWVAAGWSFSLLALPGALAIGYWLGIGCLAIGWLLAVLAALAAQRSLASSRPLAWSAPAAALLAAAFAAHQQIAMVYVALFAAVAARAELGTLWTALRRYLAIATTAGGAYIGGYLGFAHFVFPEIYARYQALDPERTTLLGDPAGGLAWFAARLGPRGAALWLDDLLWPWAPAIGLGALATAFCLIALRSPARLGTRLAIVAAAIVLAGAPAALTGYRLETYRLALPVSVAIVAAIAAGYGRGWADRIAAIGLAATLGYHASSRLAPMIASAEQETATLRAAIAASGELRDAPVEIVVQRMHRRTGTDEFGLPSMRFLFNARDAVTVIRREQGLAPVEVTISEGKAASGTGRRLVIDLRSPPAHLRSH